MTVDFDLGWDPMVQNLKIKPFIFYRCGHKFHKSCVKEKRQATEPDDQGANAHEAAPMDEECELDLNQPFITTPTYVPIAAYDKNRTRRLKHLTKKIEENRLRNLG